MNGMSGPGWKVLADKKGYSHQEVNRKIVYFPTDLQAQNCECCGAEHLPSSDLRDEELCLFCKLMIGAQPLPPSTLYSQCSIYCSLLDESQADGSFPNSLDSLLKEIKEMYGY
tara:strand:- start:8843 stop:9181 length:339 start_codon:yes stop_codon:yes gene_type:complete